MESWSYISIGDDSIPGESVSATDGNARNENEIMGWELKATSAFGTNAFMSSNQKGLNNSLFVEMDSAQSTATTIDNGSVTDRKTYAAPNAISGQEESSPKLSGSFMESNFHDVPLINLKLGRFPDQKDAQPNANHNFSSAESSLPVKRPRAGKLSSQIPFCQVYGCKKDLSNSKEYHKRHKVCEIHSKTAKVIVNGIDQRFCQQCSRFHLLSEFDDGKRSCRKRLAGHNERRRKPHVGIQPSRAGRFHDPYNGYWSTRQRLPSASSSGCALSLLSFQSQNLPNIPSSIPTGVRLVSPASQSNYGMAQMSEKLMRACSQSSTSGISNAFPTSGITTADETNMETIVVSGGTESDKYGINDFIPGSGEFRNAKNPLASGDSSTSSLLQLTSSQHQRVEHPRPYMQVKHADEMLFGLRMT